MNKKLIRNQYQLWHVDKTGSIIEGAHSDISGDLNCIRGDLTGIRGNLSYMSGDVSGISGDVSGVGGNPTNISGDVDSCEITDEERSSVIAIYDLVLKDASNE